MEIPRSCQKNTDSFRIGVEFGAAYALYQQLNMQI